MNKLKIKMEFLIKDNRITISILFAIGGILFLFLFLDSHYKELNKYKLKKLNFGKKKKIV